MGGCGDWVLKSKPANLKHNSLPQKQCNIFKKALINPKTAPRPLNHYPTKMTNPTFTYLRTGPRQEPMAPAVYYRLKSRIWLRSPGFAGL